MRLIFVRMPDPTALRSLLTLRSRLALGYGLLAFQLYTVDKFHTRYSYTRHMVPLSGQKTIQIMIRRVKCANKL